MVENMDYAAMAQMDFCQLVVDKLQVAVVKWQTDGSKQNSIEGCAFVPLIMYLDCLKLRKFLVMHTLTPRASFLMNKDLMKLYNEDLVVKGKIYLESYKFGRLPWKVSGDIVYNRPAGVLCGSSDAGPSSHARFCEPICSQLPSCDDEPPPTRGFTARRMFDNRSSSEQTFVGCKKHEEIDELLLKVLKLTEDLPTSGDRLRLVARFFPAGHGPREEDIVAAHNFDCGLVESLKFAVTNIRSSYAQLKHSQELKCARYEKDAEHILEEMNRQDGVADADNARVESAGLHASGDVGIGQTGVPGCDVHTDSYYGSQKDEDLADASSPPDVLVDKPGDENVEVRQSVGVVCVGVNQGGFVGAGGDGVNASVSVAVDSTEPSLAQESHDAVAPSQHEDADVDIGKPLDNDVPSDSVDGSPVCLASNDVPVVFRVEPHGAELSEDVAVVQTFEDPDNADVATVGSPVSQCWFRHNLAEKLFWLSLKSNSMKNLTLKMTNFLLDMVAFKTELADITIGEVGQCFWNKGMLTIGLVNFRVSLLENKFKGSPTMVVPYHICTNIWNGGSVGRSVKLMFSSKAEERVDKKDMVLFATFDPPEQRDGVGHYCVVALNVKESRFEFLDSLNKPGSSDANRIFRRMVKNIKRAWKEGSSSCDEPLDAPTLDVFKLKQVAVPIQKNGHDCGFYMFQFLQTWNGVQVAKFGDEHIGYIRKARLYSWLTSTKCSLDLTSLLIFADKGFDVGLHGGCTSLFESQGSDAVMQDCAIEISPENSGSLASGPDGGKVAPPGSSHELFDIDDDDFVTPVPRVTRTRSAAINRPPVDEAQVFSNKRAGERAFKLRDSLEKLRPPRFKYIDDARKIKDLVLSQDFVTKYKDGALLMLNDFFGDVESVKVDYMFNTFGKGACMDSYLMDYVIKYWKQDPEMSLIYRSGEHVVLSPLFITYVLQMEAMMKKNVEGYPLLPVVHSPFLLEHAVTQFKVFACDEDLLDAKLILMPRSKDGHYSLYMMNRHRETIDIHDTRRYTGHVDYMTKWRRSDYHSDCTELTRRMTLLMKSMYGEKLYTSKKHPDWVKLVEKPYYPVVAEQGTNECGIYALRLSQLYEGVRIVERIVKSDSSVEDWKAEYIFHLLFNPLNMLYYREMPADLRDLIESLGLTSLSQSQSQ